MGGAEKFFLGDQVVLGDRIFLEVLPMVTCWDSPVPALLPQPWELVGGGSRAQEGGRERPGQGKAEREGKGLGTEGAGA